MIFVQYMNLRKEIYRPVITTKSLNTQFTCFEISVTGNKLAHIAVISAYLDLGDVQDPIKNDPSHNLVASCENNDGKKVYILVSKGH